MGQTITVTLADQPLHQFLSDQQAWEAVKCVLKLSPRQAEIVKLILCGKQNKQIAKELNIKIPTIQTQLDRVYRRHDLEDRVGLILAIFGLAWQFKTS